MPHPAKRPAAPRWTPEALDLFPDDAFAALVGSPPSWYRTQYVGLAAVSPNTSPDSGAIRTAQPNTAGGRWSTLASSEVLEDEIKSLALKLNELVRGATTFKGDGYQTAARDFAMAATLLRVIVEYDKDVRWKESAAVAATRCAKASQTCAEGTDASLKLARSTSEDLAALLRGDTLSGEVQRSGDTSNSATGVGLPWHEIADRPLLMERMEESVQGRLAGALADERSLRRNAESIGHEAALLALLGHVIHQPEYEGFDDDAFSGYAESLQRAAQSLRTASKNGEFDRARDAFSLIQKSCNDCHQDYRG
jgi:hypothetical protein